MIDTQERTRAYLERRFHKNWLQACNEAWQLAQESEFLDWSDRARVLDAYFWREAKRRLGTDEVTAVVNRDAHSLPSQANVVAYSQDCAAMITGVLMMLRQGREVDCPHQAICCLISEDEAQSDAAQDWIARSDGRMVERHLASLPGFAFLFLSMCPSDSAASFMARDAFWAAMLGRP